MLAANLQFCERVQLDSIVYNELGNPQDLISDDEEIDAFNALPRYTHQYFRARRLVAERSFASYKYTTRAMYFYDLDWTTISYATPFKTFHACRE